MTGSNVKMVLFDKFHETNTCREVESLRRIGCIKELDSKVNSEVAEQLHGAYNKNKHFLNQMTPTNHIFLFRSIIDSKSIEKNKENLAKAKKQHLFTNFDAIGRPVYGHEDIPYNPFLEEHVLDGRSEDEEYSSNRNSQDNDHPNSSCSRYVSSFTSSGSSSSYNNGAYNNATERKQHDYITDNEYSDSEPDGYPQEQRNIDSESIENGNNISDIFCEIFGSDLTLSEEVHSIGQENMNEQKEAGDQCSAPIDCEEDLRSLPSNNNSEGAEEPEAPAVVRIEAKAESDSSGSRNSYERKTIDENAEDIGNVSSTIDLVDEREGSTIGMSDASMGNDSVVMTK